MKQTGPFSGVMGDYYDAWAEGSLIFNCDSEAEALEAIENYFVG